MSQLRLDAVEFYYHPDRPLLSRVSLTVERGERIVIVGANGSGKTTLLRLMAGLLRPRSGWITVNAVDATAARDRIGILFQNPDHQMIAESVEAEIALGLELRAMPPVQMAPLVDAALRRFSLESLRARPPEQLSGGQKQRVALAAITVLQPDYLLFDEPDSFLDAPSRRELNRSIETIAPDCGIVWTLPGVRRMPDADRYLALSAGELCECTRRDLENRYGAPRTDSLPCA